MGICRIVFHRAYRPSVLAAAMVAVGLFLTSDWTQAQTAGERPSSFASLKFDEVRMRRGPGLEYPMDWIYKRQNLPVEVLNEYENWLQIRDHEGTMGWVNRSQLSQRRTVIITGSVPRVMKRDPKANSQTVARLEPGVIADVTQCTLSDEPWCELEKGDARGWVRLADFWGVGRDEIPNP